MRLALAAAVAALALAPGCSSATSECDCTDPTVKIEIPADRAPDVVSVALSGRACATATAQCTQPVGSGCAEYAFRATDVGSCLVEVKLSSTPADFQETVSFAEVQCCGADYVQPPGASPIEIPGAGPDAGAAG